MSVTLWRIATDAREYEATDLSGKGAEKSGGRWNRPGRPVVYSATTVALACLETIVHLNAEDLPFNRFLVSIEVPESVWGARQTLTTSQLPIGWSAIPEGKVSLDTGDAWLMSQQSALLEVPSVVVPEEFNVLVNPLHPQTGRLKVVKVRPWFYDGRLR